MRPAWNGWKPEMHSKSVVFPAPLGPISPTISPSRTSRDTSDKAWSPPKETPTLRHSRTLGALVRVGEARGDLRHLAVLQIGLALEERELRRSDHLVG